MEELLPKIKEETSLCAGCLSKGRRLTSLKAHSSLFMYLLGQYAGLVSPNNVLLCWECSAVLKRIYQFQRQVQAAQVALMQTLNPEDEDIHCLSTLVTTKFDGMECLSTVVNACLDSAQCSTPLLANQYFIEIKKDEIEIPLLSNKYLLEIKKDEIDPSPMLENKKDQIIKEPLEICKEECQDSFAEYVPSLEDVHDDDGPAELGKNNDSQTKEKSSLLKTKKTKLKFSEHLDLKKNCEVDLENCWKSFTSSTLTEEEAAHGGIVRSSEQATGSHCCKACRIPFVSQLDFHRHNTFWHILKENSEGPFECEECHEQCRNRESLRLHWSTHNTILRCKICQQAVDGHDAMRKHLKRHAHLYACTACRLPAASAFHSYRDFFYHCRELHTKYLCDHCGTVRRSKATLTNHLRIFHDPETLKRKEAPELRYCVECNKEFPSVKAYRSHVQTSKLHNPRYNAKKKRDPAFRMCVNKNMKDRSNIIALHQKGYKISEIARELKTTRGTVRHWVRRFTKGGSLADLPRARPSWRRVSPEQVQQMLRHLENFPDTSTKVFAQQYSCSTRTIRTLLHKAGCGHYLKNPAQKVSHS